MDDGLKMFKSDGCSGSLMCVLRLVWRISFILGRVPDPDPPWEPDCIAHDKAYHPGGTATERVEADLDLARAVNALGYPFLSRLMFIGVSIGGHPLLPFPWRWGFGLPWVARYRKP